MARGKAQYMGSGAGDLIPDFSDSLKQKLREFYPELGVVSDQYFGHPADEFVAHVLAEAWWAKSTINFTTYDIKKKDIDAEWHDLLNRLEVLDERLRQISPDLDRLFGVDADPLGTADKIRELIPFVKNAQPLIDRLPKAKTPSEKSHAIAVEMSIRVLRVLRDYGISPAATAGNDITGTVSTAIQILKSIGDDMGLHFAETTWRSVINDANKDSLL